MKKRYIYLITITVLAVFLLNSCSSDVTDTEGADYLLASYYMMAGEETPLTDSGADRATVPVHTLTADSDTALPFATLITNGANDNKVNNYPEQGQKTYYTVTLEEAGIYLISARTEYPKKEDILDYTLEEYYVRDNAPAGYWTTADTIVEKVNGTWVDNSKARKSMEVHFQDGSLRKEWIVSEKTDGASYQYAHFDINGDMAIPDETDWAPAVATDMSWSSEVHYYQKINNWVSYWYKENKEVFGVRYYTESPDTVDPTKYKKTSLAYERIINRETVSNDEEATWNWLMDLL